MPSSRIPTRLWSLFFAACTVPSAFAQDVLAPDAYIAATTQAAAPADSLAGRTPFFTWGPFALHPTLAYRYEYGDGLRRGPGESVKSARHRLSANLRLDAGPHWTAEYTPTWNYFSNDAFEDGVDHHVGLNGNLGYENWIFRPTYSFSKSSPLLAETASQTEQKLHDVDLTIGRSFGDQFGAELNLNQNMRYAGRPPDVRDRSITSTVRYQFASSLGVHGGLTFGRTDVQDSPDMEYWRPNVGATWQATPKTRLGGHVGWERRKFLEGLDLTQSTPIFGLSLTMNPFTYTTLVATASKQVSASYFAGQTREGTEWALDLKQRLLGRLWLDAGMTQSDVEFASSFFGLDIVRNDERKAYYVKLGTDFLQGGRASIGFSRSENDSDLADFGFTSSQISVEVSQRF